MASTKLTVVSTMAGFNPLAPAIRGNDKWELVRLARELWDRTGGRYTGVDILPCGPDAGQCDQYRDMVAALRSIGYTDNSTFVFTPGEIDLTDPAKREAGKLALLQQVLLGESVGASFNAGPVTEGWVTDLVLGDVSDSQFDNEVVGPVSHALAWVADEAAKTCKNVGQLLAEYLCRREYRRSTRPSRIARVVRAANKLITGPIKWGVLHDTSHLWDWASNNGKSLADVGTELATTDDLPVPKRWHLSAVFTRGAIDANTPMPTKALMSLIAGQAVGTWAIEAFPWWDEGVRGAIAGFGTPTFGNDDMIGVLARAAQFVDSL